MCCGQKMTELVPGTTGGAVEKHVPATFEAIKRWTMSIRNWGQVYGELCTMYEGRLPE